MTRKNAIKWIIIILVVGVLIGGGTWLGIYLTNQGATGAIEYGKEYKLIGLRPQTFFTKDGQVINATPNSTSYFKINTDKKTGEVAFVEANRVINFIVTSYKTERGGTTFDIEYIQGDKIIRLRATSGNTKIEFRALADYSVSVTTEQPNEITEIEYNSSMMVFARGGA